MIALAKPDNRIDTVLGCVVHGDALAVLKTMESNSVDAIVTDPPAGIAFMGKEWDNFNSGKKRDGQAERDAYRAVDLSRPGYANSHGTGQPTKAERDAFIAFLSAVMSEALRVLKPGGHALVWALPRTSHWTALALEDAGFEIREKCYHLFGSGFPKSHNISIAIDKHLKAEREVIGKSNRHGGGTLSGASWNIPAEIPNITAPATPEAAQWQGWGTSTKPAVEEWILCRKPLAEPSIAANVLKYGVGGINVDACRVGYANEQDKEQALSGDAFKRKDTSDKTAWARPWMDNPERVAQMNREAKERAQQGRWPANLLLSHSLWCTPNGTKRVRGNGRPNSVDNLYSDVGYGGRGTHTIGPQYNDEEIEAWHCAEDCPIRLLDEQSGVRKSGAKMPHHIRTTAKGKNAWGNGVGGGTLQAMPEYYPSSEGGASRYFTNLPPDVPFIYQPKASRAERNAGCEGLPERAKDNVYADGLNSATKLATPQQQLNGTVDRGLTQNVHPTVKPISLMRWLVRLVTPPDGIVLDPFLGSGSTAVAAIHEGYHFIGIEQDASYVAISEARIAHARREVSL